MTDFGAYDRGLPCKNKSCKSHGSPHPNCKCYPGLAEGGDVTTFCGEDRSHDPSCKYFMYAGTLGSEDPGDAVSGYMAHHGLHGLLKMGSNIGEDALEKYDKSVVRGAKAVSGTIKNLFEGSKIEGADHEKSKDAIHDWLKNGGITNDMQQEIYKQNATPQNFAEGGQAKALPQGVLHDHPVVHTYPQQNVLLQSAKGRASEYLSALKPQENEPRLAFDDMPDQADKKKAYRKALGIAANPVGILRKIQKGTIDQDHVKHLNALYPELSERLQKKVTEEIVKAQLRGKKPSYKVRQGLSLFLGVPLSGEMSPQNIAAAQATFQSKPSPAQQGGGNGVTKSKGSALTKMSQSLLTADQASASRQQKQ